MTLIPFLLAWRAGRRLARASYTDQLWQAFLGAFVVYAAFGTATGFVCRTPEVIINLWFAMTIPLISFGLGMIVGARREAGSWSRLIGVDAVAWLAKTSQHSRWAGSYVGSALKAGFVAAMASVCLAAVLLAVTIVWHWTDIIAVYEGIQAGALGGAVLTIAQLGFLPNLVIFALSWSTGAGFSLGVGSTAGPLGTAVGPLPAVPVLGALPAGQLDAGAMALALPVIAGILAGWWFLREGENHFDEWLSIKIKARWFTASRLNPVPGGVHWRSCGALGGALAWIARGSAGIGRLTEIGPHPLWTAVWLAAEVGIGVVIGYAVGPWLERSQKQREANLDEAAYDDEHA